MATKYYASKLLSIAENQVGYLEKETNKDLYDKTANAGDENYNKFAYELDTKYPTVMNGKKNGYAWCACFVVWCFITAFGENAAKKLLGLPDKSYAASCTSFTKYLKAIDCFVLNNPKSGDIIFFEDSHGEPCHVGLVEKVDSKYVYTIEGNTSSASGVVANGGAVAKKSYKLTYSRIYGYGRPKYDTEVATKTKTEIKNTTTSTPTTKTNAKVKAFQTAAIADGYKSYLKSGVDGIWGSECDALAKNLNLKKQTFKYTNKNLVKFIQTQLGFNSSDIDGKFGSSTQKAVKNFQKNNGLTADGVVGINTWKKLCKV